MDQNSTSSSNPPTGDTSTIDQTQPNQIVTQANPIIQDGQNTQQVSDPVTDQSAPIIQVDASTDNPAQTASYIEAVGESTVSLLDDISADESLIQIVATEMKLDTSRVKSTLAALLDKIDKEQITTEELALIMAASVVDVPPDLE